MSRGTGKIKGEHEFPQVSLHVMGVVTGVFSRKCSLVYDFGPLDVP